MRVNPFAAEFSEGAPVDELKVYLELPEEVPTDRPYTWSNGVTTADFRISWLEKDAMDAVHIVRAHEPDSGSVADHRGLHFMWAMADAVMGTGAILRVEPDIKWIPSLYDDIAAYRKVLGKERAYPINVVLTGSGNIDTDHPMLTDDSILTVIMTTEQGAERIYSKKDRKELNEMKTVAEVLSKGKSIEYRDVMRALRQNYDVKYLDITAGGVVIGGLLREGLLDEVRLTEVGNLAGQYNSGGRERPLAISLPKDDPLLPDKTIHFDLMGLRTYTNGKSSYIFKRYGVGRNR